MTTNQTFASIFTEGSNNNQTSSRTSSSSAHSLHSSSTDDCCYNQSLGSSSSTALKTNILSSEQLLNLPLSSPSSSGHSSNSSSSSTTGDSSNHHDQSSNNKQHSLSSSSSPITKFVFILNAFVTGFAQLKLSADKIDYEYIVEIYWSNEQRTFIKRTYQDFALFHAKLVQTFFTNNKQSILTSTINLSKKSLVNSKYRDDYVDSIPVLPANKKPFWISHLKLAEMREMELNSYVQRLIKLPSKVSHSSLFLEFFESRHSSDPKPHQPPALAATATSCDEVASDSVEEDETRDEQFDEYEHPEENDSSSSNNNLAHDIVNDSVEEAIDFDYDEDDDDDDDDDGNRLERRTLNNEQIGLWWDEDNALNELTTSVSFDFSTRQQKNYNELERQKSEDPEDLDMLEKIFKNSELLKNKSNEALSLKRQPLTYQ